MLTQNLLPVYLNMSVLEVIVFSWSRGSSAMADILDF